MPSMRAGVPCRVMSMASGAIFHNLMPRERYKMIVQTELSCVSSSKRAAYSPFHDGGAGEHMFFKIVPRLYF